MNQSALQINHDPVLRKLVSRHHELLRTSQIAGQVLAANVEVEQLPELVLDEASRKHWLDCLWQALDELEITDEEREQFWNWMEPLSLQMVSRGSMNVEPRRYPFNWVLRCKRYPALGMCRR